MGFNDKHFLIWVGPGKARSLELVSNSYDHILIIEAMKEFIPSLNHYFKDDKYEVIQSQAYFLNKPKFFNVFDRESLSSETTVNEINKIYPNIVLIEQREIKPFSVSEYIDKNDKAALIDILIEDKAVLYDFLCAINDCRISNNLRTVYTTYNLNADPDFKELLEDLSISVENYKFYTKLIINRFYYKLLKKEEQFRELKYQRDYEVENLNLKLLSMENDLNQQIGKNKELSDTLNYKENQIEKLNNEIVQFEKEIEANKKRYDTLINEFNGLTERLQFSQSQVESLKLEVNSLSVEFNHKEKLHQEKLNSLDLRYQDLTLVTNERKDLYEQLQNELKVERDRYLELVNQIEKQKLNSVSMTKYNQSIKRQKSLESALAGKVSEEEYQIALKQKAVLEKKLNKKQNDLTNLESKYESIKTQLTRARAVIEQQSFPMVDYELSKNTIQLKDIDIDSLIKSFPKQDLVHESFDLVSENKVTDVLLILSTPRSGSTWFCHILKNNNVAIPHEYFQPYQYLPILAERWDCIADDGVLNKQKYIDSLFVHRSINGCFSVNLHESHLHLFDEFRPNIKNCNFHYLFLRRENLVKQAVSYEIASQTSKWSSSFEGQATPKYSFPNILTRYESLQQQNVLIKEYLHKRGCQYTELVYEDMLSQPSDYLNEKLPDFLDQDIKIEESTQIQSNKMNSEWELRFIDELKVKHNPNEIGPIVIS